MAGIASFSGLGSGIDFGVIRDAILAQKTLPVTQMQNKVTDYTSRVNALTSLNAGLATLTTAAEALTNTELGAGRSIATGDGTIITGSADATANIGSYNLTVNRLASSLTQASRSYASTTDPILTGGATTATFELRKGGASTGVPITIDSTNNSLAGLRDAINNAPNAGVKASIIDVNGDGTGQQLILTSTDTGASGRVELAETTSTGTLADLNLRSLNPTDGDFTELNASLTVNGLTLTRSSNTVSDAVTGVTLNLKKIGSTSVGVTQSTDIQNKLNAFINAYNAIQNYVVQQYQVDSNNKPQGVLAGDSTLRNIQQQLREATNAISSNNGGSFNSLADIGISKDQNGVLSLDATVFNDKLTNNPDDVKSLIYGKTASQTGLFQNINAISKGLSDNISGAVQTAITGYQSTIKTLNNSIADRQAALDLLKTSLTNQFSVADAAIGQLTSQGTALTNIIKSLQTNTTNG